MKWKLDENVPAFLAEAFRTAGHEVETVLHEGLSGADDARVLRAAAEEGRAIVTLDSGFADVRNLVGLDHAGIVVLRLKDQTREAIARVGLRLLNSGLLGDLSASVMVVDERRIRIRRHPSRGSR